MCEVSYEHCIHVNSWEDLYCALSYGLPIFYVGLFVVMIMIGHKDIPSISQ